MTFECNYRTDVQVEYTQWQIRDFPLGGCQPIGGVPTSDAHTFWQKRVKMKEMDPVGGGVPVAPPGSANDTTWASDMSNVR